MFVRALTSTRMFSLFSLKIGRPNLLLTHITMQVALDCPHILTRMWFNLPDVRQPLKKSPTPASLRINPITANHHSCKALSSCKASNASQSTPAANNCIRRLLPMQHLEEGRSNTSSAAQILDLACARLHEPAGNLATSAATNARGSKRVTGGVCVCV